MKTFKLKNSNLEAKIGDFMGYYLYLNEKKIGMAIKSGIEDDPDWIEQPEKDYEVLEVRGPAGGSFKPSTPTHIQNFSIHSVKRLSDGEVFSVNDLHTGSKFSDPLPILKILEADNTVFFKQRRGKTKLSNAKKVTRTPTLTSEDGVELFDGDRCFWVNPDMGWGYGLVEVNDVNRDCKYFSTREAAEEYRLNNAQKISVQDMVDMFGLSSSCNDVFRMQELVKSRLNL